MRCGSYVSTCRDLMHIKTTCNRDNENIKNKPLLLPTHLQAFNYKKNPMNLFTPSRQRTTSSNKVLQYDRLRICRWWCVTFHDVAWRGWACCCGVIASAEPDGTRAETRIRLSPKRTSPFKSVGASVPSTTGSRGVRISSSNGSNAGQTTLRGKVELYWLPTPFACFPFTSPTRASRCATRFRTSSTRGRVKRRFLFQTSPPGT